MPQFLIKKSEIADSIVSLTGDEAHHARDVFRLKDGDDIRLFDGTGTGYLGRIKQLSKKKVDVDILSTFESGPKSPSEIILAQSIISKDAMDMSIHKATELNVTEIIPLLTERSSVKPDSSKRKKKIDHWKKICTAACKQSGRLTIPRINNIETVDELVAHLDDYSSVVFANINKDAKPLRDCLSELCRPGKILVVVGPEGNFTKNEIKSILSKDVCEVSLGQNILKSETASMYIVSVLHSHITTFCCH